MVRRAAGLRQPAPRHHRHREGRTRRARLQRCVRAVGRLERFRAKWIPVRVKKTRQNKNLEPGSDSIRTQKALGCTQPGGHKSCRCAGGNMKKFQRRQFLQLAAGAAALPLTSGNASAQAYPSRPVRLVIGYTPGGSADLTARLMGQWLSEKLGQSFVVENRPGGGTNIATEAVLRAPPDGYTLLLVAPANAINATLYDKLNFNFIKEVEPVAGLIRFPNVVVVNPELPIKTIPELIAYAKANPGKLNMASSGNGSTIHMSGELFKMLTDTNMVHVPYRGGAPALTDLIAGQVQVMFDNIPTCFEHVKSGKLRGLAVTSTTRSEILPDLPLVADFLPGYEASAWYGIGAPKGTPPDIVERLNKVVNEILADPKAKARFTELGAILLPGSAADFGKLVADETEKWGKVVKFAGAKVE